MPHLQNSHACQSKEAGEQQKHPEEKSKPTLGALAAGQCSELLSANHSRASESTLQLQKHAEELFFDCSKFGCWGALSTALRK